MSDVWYYARGETTHGPFTLAELTPLLAAASKPGDVLVWRPGMNGWDRAEKVKEVATQLFKPPPVREIDGSRLPPSPPMLFVDSAPEPMVRATSNSKISTRPHFTGDPRLTGIGGWLVLVALGQALGPFKYVATVVQTYEKVDSNLFSRFPITMYGELLLNGLFFLFVVYTSYLFFTKSRWFPVFFIWEILLSFLTFPIDWLFVAVTLSIYTGMPIRQFVPDLTPQEVGPLLGLLIVGAIWIPYILKSRRVANTFVR